MSTKDHLRNSFTALFEGDVKPILWIAGAGSLALIGIVSNVDALSSGWPRIVGWILLFVAVVSFLFYVALEAWCAYQARKEGPANVAVDKRRILGKVAVVVAGVLVIFVVAAVSALVTAHRLEPQIPTLESNLVEWGYPPDLQDVQDQLDELKLGPSIKDVSWIKSDLEVLDATGVPVDRVEKPSTRLKGLYLGGTYVSSLPDLPESTEDLNLDSLTFDKPPAVPWLLEELSLKQTTFPGSIVLPENISSLVITGDPPWRERWPEDLKKLVLYNPPPSLYSNLPQTVTELEIRNPATDLFDPGVVSDNVRSLTLESVHLESLESLPAGLEELYLIEGHVDNLCALVGSEREVSGSSHESSGDERRYPRLRKLVLDQVLIQEDCGWPKSLESLEYTPFDAHSGRKTHFNDLPSDLRSLKIRWYASEKPIDLPGLLEKLTISFAEVPALPTLPPYLEELDVSNTSITGFVGEPPRSLNSLAMKGCRSFDLKKIPERLETLNLQGCRISDLGSLRGGKLSALNVAGTRLEALPQLPERLKVLDISNTGIHDLMHLPPFLEELTLHEGQVTSLEGLPTSVRVLRFVKKVERGDDQSPGDQAAR